MLTNFFICITILLYEKFEKRRAEKRSVVAARLSHLEGKMVEMTYRVGAGTKVIRGQYLDCVCQGSGTYFYILRGSVERMTWCRPIALSGCRS